MKKDYSPHENILYTFLFDNGKLHTFRYVGQLNEDYALMHLYLPNGQIRMTKMTYSRFKFLMQNQYKSEVPIEDVKKDFNKKKEEDAQRVKALEEKKNDEQEQQINALLTFIRNINGADAEKARAFLGETPKDLADKIDKANGIEFGELLLKAEQLIKHLKGA